MIRSNITTTLAIVAAASSLMVSTVSPAMADSRTKGTVTGALVGGALGALVTHGSGRGALIGAVAGGVIGNVTSGHHGHRHYYYRHGHRYYRNY